MAIEVLKDAFVSINAVNLSDHVESVTIDDSVSLEDASVMGDAAQRRLAGLRDWTLTVNFRQDFDAAKVDATLQSLVGVQTAIKVRKSSAAISATNPERQGNGMLESLPIVAGSVGTTHNVSVSFRCSDGVALIRATA